MNQSGLPIHLPNDGLATKTAGYELIRAITLWINGQFGPTEKRMRRAAHLWEFFCAILIF